MFKKAKVVMLPTNEKAKFYIDRYGNLKIHNTESTLPLDSIGNNQHLYILLDEEIKEGDWCWNSYKGESEICIGQVGKTWYEGMKKIIATTDKSLLSTIHIPSPEFRDIWELPQPSQSFIQKFVEEYNKGNIITEVMVKYEDKIAMDGHTIVGIEPKINPKDNTITIRKVKDSWSKEELRNIAYAMYCMGRDEQQKSKEGKYINNFDKWIEENL